MHEIKEWGDNFILVDSGGVYRDQSPENLAKPRSCQEYALFPTVGSAQEMARRLDDEENRKDRDKEQRDAAERHAYLERKSQETAAIVGTLDRKRELESATATIAILKRRLYEAESQEHQAVQSLDRARAHVLELEVARDTAAAVVVTVQKKLAEEQSRLEKSKGARP